MGFVGMPFFLLLAVAQLQFNSFLLPFPIDPVCVSSLYGQRLKLCEIDVLGE